MSYVIWNCPAYNEKGCLHIASIFPDESMCNRYITFAVPCQDCTDCVLKQIVELCKRIKCPCEYKGADCLECTESGAKRFADRILQLLDIQEINDAE